MRFGILRDISNTSDYYVNACEELSVDYTLIDIMSHDWIEKIRSSECDGFLVAPNCTKDIWKCMYQERLYYINIVMGYPIYPSYNELFLYESKRNMAYWLQINNIPTAKTWVFYNKKEAIDFIYGFDKFPLVFKPNIGSSSLGIKFIKSKGEALGLIKRVFTKWRFYNRGYTKWYKTRFKVSYPIMDDKQYNNLLFQEKIDVKYEWRGVKIGESYFAHKKLAGNNGLHSGSGISNYDSPPIEVMEFIKYVCDVGKFRSMDVDFFEDVNGNFYVNELQAIFGSKIKPYQMCVDGKPGRYQYIDGNWVFEEGMFNQNNSFNLRVKDFIDMLMDE
ncbi:MAG: hypothetical protein GX796_02435 [Clostridiaceae bacterium]|jgi:hypothetical protein|nr:hypothetical protein [Clostridiaceae bacterium]